MRGKGGCGVSAIEYSCAHGAQINFGDLTPYFTYVVSRVVDPDPHGSALICVAESGSGSRRAEMTHKYRKKYRIFLSSKPWIRNWIRIHN
jgi:hypothetical protein